jgi:lipid-binding SYLF domain-containing protein
MSVRLTRLILLALMPMLHVQPAIADDWQADPGRKLEVRAERAISRMQTDIERSLPYFKDAYAIAVWPGIGRIGFGFGGAYGRGIVIEQGKAVGTVGYWQFSSGIQAGLKSFTMVVFFRNKEALDDLKAGKIQFAGQAGVDFATVGAHGTPTYNQGVAIIAMTNFGLMGEFAAAGVKYNYKAYSNSTEGPAE